MCLGAQSRHPIHLFVHLLIDAAALSNFKFLRPPSQSSWKHRASIVRRVMYKTRLQFFGPFRRPLLFSNANAIVAAARGINSGWPFLAGFDTTFGITSKKFELIGISINSLRRGANPVCLFIVNAKTPARTTSRLHLQPAPRCLPSPA